MSTLQTKIIVRPMPEGYLSDCWIVTGPIYNSEVRYYRHFEDAKKYAKQLIKEFNKGNWQPMELVIEERQSDIMQREPIFETYNEDHTKEDY